MGTDKKKDNNKDKKPKVKAKTKAKVKAEAKANRAESNQQPDSKADSDEGSYKNKVAVKQRSKGKMAWDVVQINCDAITDWPSFHMEFAEAFGFPDYYDSTIESWIEMMSNLDNESARVTAVYCDPGEVITIELLNVVSFLKRCPEQFSLLLEAFGYVNWRRLELEQNPIITLAFFGAQIYQTS